MIEIANLEEWTKEYPDPENQKKHVSVMTVSW